MKVKTLKPHENGYGEKYAKAKGAVYSLPADMAKTLIAQGFVEEVKEDEKPAAKSKPAGNGGD